MKLYIVVIVVSVLTSRAVSLDNLQFCSGSDPSLNGCLKSAIQNALVTLKNGDLPNEPMVMSKYTVMAKPPFAFNKEYSNIKMYNASSFVVEDVSAKIDKEGFSITLQTFIPSSFVVVANYSFQDVTLGETEVSSSGVVTFYHDKMSINFTVSGVPNEIDGITYALITDHQLDLNLEKLRTLFESDNVKAAHTLTSFINDHWKSAFTEEKGGYSEFYGEGFKNYTQAVFSLIPYDTLFPK